MVSAGFLLFQEELHLEDYVGKVTGKKSDIDLPPLPRPKADPKDSTGIKIHRDDLREEFYSRLNQEERIKLALGFVNELYEVVLGREPESIERRGKVNILVQGGTREGIYRSLVLGEEYRIRRQGNRYPLSEKNDKFVLDYLKKYLNLSVSKWEKNNFFVVKELVTEKTLEMIDAFKEKSDVNRWFAVFSEDLEQKLVWSQGHRKLGSRQAYMHWGERIPLDIIKSEIMIKIHRLMNSLQ